MNEWLASIYDSLFRAAVGRAGFDHDRAADAVQEAVLEFLQRNAGRAGHFAPTEADRLGLMQRAGELAWNSIRGESRHLRWWRRLFGERGLGEQRDTDGGPISKRAELRRRRSKGEPPPADPFDPRADVPTDCERTRDFLDEIGDCLRALQAETYRPAVFDRMMEHQVVPARCAALLERYGTSLAAVRAWRDRTDRSLQNVHYTRGLRALRECVAHQHSAPGGPTHG